jgi:hypothetical protein
MIELMKNTRDGENRSEIVKMAKTKVPEIKPNCIALVKWAKNWGSSPRSFDMSEITEFPANQSEVQRNCANTIMGKINLIQ